MNDRTSDVLRGLLVTHSPEISDPASIADDTTLAAIGIDSLEMLSLAVDIENAFDVDLDDAAVASVRTVRELDAIVAAARQAEPR